MCPVKTETISVNVPREEAAFWRKVAFDLGQKSRGHLQKLALLLGLEALAPERAAELRAIRAKYYRQAAGAFLLMVFGAMLAGNGRESAVRACNRVALRCRTCVVSGRTIEEEI